MSSLQIVYCYLAFLILLGVFSRYLSKGTSKDYFLASHSIGPFMLLMSVFGTTMTAFALVGSTGEAYRRGVGIYGMLASLSGLVHSAVFFLVGVKVWKLGKKYGYLTQIEFLRDRFDNKWIGFLLFPVIILLVMPYILIGILGSGQVLSTISEKSISFNQAAAIVTFVVLIYVFLGGVRGAAIANTFQTIVFMVLGVIAFYFIAKGLGGPVAATQTVLEQHPEKLSRMNIPHVEFLTYFFIPLSVAMFPHLFQHWLTAKSAKSFKLTVVLHPICIMIVWIPCILIGIWATSAMLNGELIVPLKHKPNAELAIMVEKLTSDTLAGFLTAGILAAIMSSLDSQFFCLGTMFTNDILFQFKAKDSFSDKAKIFWARCFIVVIVLVTYLIAINISDSAKKVFPLAVWCFSGFASLSPIIFAALYWKRATGLGVILSILAVVVSWLVLFIHYDYGATRVEGVMPVTYMFGLSVLFLVIGSLLSKPPQEDTIKKFFNS